LKQQIQINLQSKNDATKYRESDERETRLAQG